MEKAQQKTPWTYVFKAIGFCIGAGLIVIGILDVLSFSLSDPITIVLPIYYV